MTDIPSRLILEPEKNILNLPDKDAYYPLLHALRCKYVGKELGAFLAPPQLTFSRSLSALAKQPCYLFPGLDILEGKKEEKIKNYQILGNIVDLIWPTLETLNALPEDQLTLRKQQFLQARPSANPDAIEKITPLHLAIWESLHDTPVVTPTSGNYGLAALDWLEKLRSITIAENVPLLAADEGKIVLWLPEPNDITRSKLQEITSRSDALNKQKLDNGHTYGLWQKVENRDPDSLIYALRHGAHYWQTNPFSAADIKTKLLDEVVKREGESALHTPAAKRTLRGMGCKINDTTDTITISQGSLGGQHGLILARLEIEELMAAEKEKILVVPPSAGGAAAACIEGGRMLKAISNDISMQKPCFSTAGDRQEFDTRLHEHFPKLATALFSAPTEYAGNHRTKTQLARHTGNNNLVEGLQLHDQPARSERYVSGIGSTKPMRYPTGVFKHSLALGGELSTEADIIPTPIMFTKLAQVLIFSDRLETDPNAQMPEEAGAIAAGGVLHRSFQQHKWNEQDMARILRNKHIDRETFTRLAGDEFHSHAYDGPALDSVMKRILEAIDAKTPQTGTTEPGYCSNVPTICYATGNTGTREISDNFKSR